MATKVRQIIPSAGSLGVMHTGREYVCEDAEAKRLAAAGHVEIVKTGVPKSDILRPEIAKGEATHEEQSKSAGGASADDPGTGGEADPDNQPPAA